MWPAGAACRPGARGPGTYSAPAPGSCASPTARAVSRPPSGPRAHASAARAAPPRGVAPDCAPAPRWKTSARRRVSPAFSTTHSPPFFSSPHGPRAPFLQSSYPLQGPGDPRALPRYPRHSPLGNLEMTLSSVPVPHTALQLHSQVSTPSHDPDTPFRETEDLRLLSSPACALQPPSLFPALLSPQIETPHPFLMLAVPSHLLP